MSKINPAYSDNDMDIIELFLLMWVNKWLIIAFIIIGIAGGSTYIFLNNNSIINNNLYESKISIYVEKTSLNNDGYIENYFRNYEKSIFREFQKTFYSEKNFKKWKNDNKDSSITFEKFSNNKIYEGIVTVKNDDERFTRLVEEKKESQTKYYIKVYASKIHQINEIFDYANYANDIFTNKLILTLESDFDFIYNSINKYYLELSLTASSGLIDRLIILKKHLGSLNKGSKIINFENPTEPINLNTSKETSVYIKLVIFGFLSGIIGILFVIMRNAYRQHVKFN